MERQRLARLAGITLTAAIAFEGCGGQSATNSPVTPEPTKSPDKMVVVATPRPSPTESIVIPSQTPEVTPSPTAKPTPEARPTPKPKTIESLIDSGHPAISAKKLQTDIDNAFKGNDSLKASYTYAKGFYKTCETGNNEPFAKDREIVRRGGCEELVFTIFQTYQQTGDKKFYTLALEAYNHAISPSGLGNDYKQELDGYLKHNFN